MSYRETLSAPTIVAIAVLVSAPSSEAQLLRDVGGLVDVAAVQSRSVGADQRTLRGLYQVTWGRHVLPYVHLRAGLRYSRFDLDLPEADNTWREELQPSGELSWKHPGFTFTANATRRESTSRLTTTDVTRDEIGLLFRTRSVTWPILTLRYDHLRTFDDVIPRRDTRDGRFAAEVSYTVGAQTASYRYRHGRLRNVITDLESDEDVHRASWSGQLLSLGDDRFRLTSGYRYEHRRRKDASVGSGAILSPVPLVAGLYSRDSSPDLDALEELEALVDGDLSTPTDPPIEIGGVFNDQNVGADLRVPTEVSALYVHVDGPSGSGVIWDVYVSDDNFAWAAVTPPAATRFNLANTRYELSFQPVSARYVKAVNGGTNEVLEVRVTEIEVFEEIRDVDVSRTITNSHLADARAAYSIRSDLFATADFTYQHLPSSGARSGSDNYAYSLTARYQQRETLSHTGRWEQDFQTDRDEQPSFSASTLSYTLDAAPLASVRGLTSLTARRTFMGGDPEDEILTALARLRADPLPQLSVTTEVNRSRTDQIDADLRFDSWTGRTGVTGTVTRWLEMNLGARIQYTYTTPTSTETTRRTYRAGAEARPTRTILLRGDVSITDDRGATTSQDYLMSWNLTPQVTLNSQVRLNRSRSGSVSDRYSGTMTFALARRGSLYFIYTHLFQRGTSDQTTNTFQQGVRYAF